MHPLARAGCALAALLLGSGPAGAISSFRGLGHLPATLSPSSEASGVSADGVAVAGVSNTDAGFTAFRWTAVTGLTALGFLPELNFSRGVGISGDGSTVVGVSGVLNQVQAARWPSGGGVEGLGWLPGGLTNSIAFGTSSDGSVVVGRSDSGLGAAFEAFVWTQASGVMQGLGFLNGGSTSAAFAVSADGTVIVGAADDAIGNIAVRWTQSGAAVQELGFLPGGSVSAATGVSADGSVVVGESDTGTAAEAFRWTAAGGIQGLGTLPGGSSFSHAADVSADGSVVVGEALTATGATTAFIWDAGNGMRRLQNVLGASGAVNVAGWTLEVATGISDDGATVVGWGLDPGGVREGWIATVPEPSRALLSAAALLGLLSLSRLWGAGRFRSAAPLRRSL